MIEIPLHGAKANGRVALASDEDYEIVSHHRWHVWEVTRASGHVAGPYARTRWWRDGVYSHIFMHSLITGYAQTDHRNGNGLDNQRSNLRPATAPQNNHNQPGLANHSSRYKGVTWHKGARKWQAAIGVAGKCRYLGLFASEEDAAQAYEAAALEIQGEYAYAARPGSGTRGAP